MEIKVQKYGTYQHILIKKAKKNSANTKKTWVHYTKQLEISEHKCIIKLQRTFVLIYTTERRVQSNIAQKNMQDMYMRLHT